MTMRQIARTLLRQCVTLAVGAFAVFGIILIEVKVTFLFPFARAAMEKWFAVSLFCGGLAGAIAMMVFAELQIRYAVLLYAALAVFVFVIGSPLDAFLSAGGVAAGGVAGICALRVPFRPIRRRHEHQTLEGKSILVELPPHLPRARRTCQILGAFMMGTFWIFSIPTSDFAENRYFPEERPRDPSAQRSSQISRHFLHLAWGTTLGSVWLLIGYKILTAGRKFVSFSDPAAIREASVLYLRSFAQDMGGDSRKSRQSLEQVVVSGFSTLGTTLAVGRPGDALPPLGSLRVYVADGVWQQFVSDMVARVRAVVLAAGRSGGLAWELEHVISRKRPDQVLILLPFRYRWKLKERERLYGEFRGWARSLFPKGLPEACGHSVAVLFEQDWTPRQLPSDAMGASCHELAGAVAEISNPRLVRASRFGWLMAGVFFGSIVFVFISIIFLGIGLELGPRTGISGWYVLPAYLAFLLVCYMIYRGLRRAIGVA